MKTYKNIYSEIYNINNLMKAWRKARKGKTKKEYVIEFEKDTMGNIFKLQKELIEQTYEPKPLKIFIVRDPKTRKIAKSAFRDRVIHHALVRVIEPIFDKTFIYDSCANRKSKGNLFALKRFDEFKRKVSSNGKIIPNKFNTGKTLLFPVQENQKTQKFSCNNNYVKGYCFKADIKHYFHEVNHDILINSIKKKIQDEKVIWLIEKILKNRASGGGGDATWKLDIPIFC